MLRDILDRFVRRDLEVISNVCEEKSQRRNFDATSTPSIVNEEEKRLTDLDNVGEKVGALESEILDNNVDHVV